MSSANNNESVSDAALIETFKENDQILVGLVNKLKNIYANTLMIDKQIKIDALRREIVNEDIKCQLNKIAMINQVLNDIE